MPQPQETIFEDARIIFRNFAGRENQYNASGDRNFCLILDEKVAALMAQDGWNVKTLRARDVEEAPQPYLQVKVNFDGPRPPAVVLITSRGRTTLPVELLPMVDYADMENVDLILNPYKWTVGVRSGISAYLKSIYITLRENKLELKYAELPEIGIGAPEQQAIAAAPHKSWDYEGVVEEEAF